VLWWLRRYKEMLALGEEGRALLGEDTESVEAVLMNATEAWAYHDDAQRRGQLTMRNARLLPRLPYSEDLRAPYMHLVMVCAERRNMEEAEKWLIALQQQAEQHHDLLALYEVHFYRGQFIHEGTGDLRSALRQYERSLEVVEKS